MHQIAKGYSDAQIEALARLLRARSARGTDCTRRRVSSRRRAASLRRAACGDAPPAPRRRPEGARRRGGRRATAAPPRPSYMPHCSIPHRGRAGRARTRRFVSCPLSNLVLGGIQVRMADITRPYTALAQVRRARGARHAPARSTSAKAGAPRRRRSARYDRADRLARRRLHVRRGAGRGAAAEARARAARLEGGRRPRRCAGSSRRCPTAASS